jgi:hypothetical protein
MTPGKNGTKRPTANGLARPKALSQVRYQYPVMAMATPLLSADSSSPAWSAVDNGERASSQGQSSLSKLMSRVFRHLEPGSKHNDIDAR